MFNVKRWSEAIAIGSLAFVEKIKNDLGEEKGTGYFSVVTSSGRVLEALSKDEKLVPMVQAVQCVRPFEKPHGRLSRRPSVPSPVEESP